MKLDLYQQSGEKKGSVDVNDKIFGVPVNEELMRLALVRQAANARQANAHVKTRGEVRGGGKKPWRQKGTGRARAGTIRSPIWRGGGQIFPASTSDFSQKVNRKMYRSAIRSILSELVRQEKLVVVDKFGLEEPKTKQLLALLAAFGGADCLIISESKDANLELSARNLHKVDVREASAIDPVSLIRHQKVLVTVEALKKIEEWLQ